MLDSAALWMSAAEQHAARNDVFSRAGRLADTAVSISCGTADPFLAADRAFWRRMLPAQVRFLGRAL